MKIVSALLVIVLLLHLGCVGSCVAASTEPPCHQHQSQQNINSSCSDRPLIEAKTAATGKCALELVAMLPVLTQTVAFNELASLQHAADNPPGISDTSVTTPVLRI